MKPITTIQLVKAVSRANGSEVLQTYSAWKEGRVLMQTSKLLEKMFSSQQLNAALKQVKSNKGCAGIDRLSIEATIEKLGQGDNGNRFRQSFLDTR